MVPWRFNQTRTRWGGGVGVGEQVRPNSFNLKLWRIELDVSASVMDQQTQNICITFVQRRPNVLDVGPTLYKCYTDVLCLLGVGFDSRNRLLSTFRLILFISEASLFPDILFIFTNGVTHVCKNVKFWWHLWWHLFWRWSSLEWLRKWRVAHKRFFSPFWIWSCGTMDVIWEYRADPCFLSCTSN